MGLLRRTEITASQQGVLEGYTPDPELAEVVKRLPGYLQPVVTLMATMVPQTEEEGTGGAGPGHQHGSLDECSFLCIFIKWQQTAILTISFLYFSERDGHGLVAPRL